MSRSSDPDQPKVLADIQRHLQAKGPKDWHLVRDKYPDKFPMTAAGTRKWWRWVDLVRGEGKGSVEHRDAAVAIAVEAGKHLPVAPSPAFIARDPPRARNQIDFLKGIGEVWDDLMLLRARGRVVDAATGEVSVRNPKMLMDSVHGRLKTVETALRVMQEVWDLERMERFYSAVIDIIVNEVQPADPEMALRIMKRLRALNDDQTMTAEANPMNARRDFDVEPTAPAEPYF